ncbi:hypothetical protein D3W54_13040 [Komagataeibacter medellinensis]|uniref:Transposase n=1 Tax=Komagataeibacter medellinensis TaxID=1177712 RepID=A0ABQ6VXW0_9PROT|nr:hypothetical protein D3W54_13040 [Komagataeibacter medellinensis]
MKRHDVYPAHAQHGASHHPAVLPGGASLYLTPCIARNMRQSIKTFLVRLFQKSFSQRRLLRKRQHPETLILFNQVIILEQPLAWPHSIFAGQPC